LLASRFCGRILVVTEPMCDAGMSGGGWKCGANHKSVDTVNVYSVSLTAVTATVTVMKT
jgi:hypothetical protein